MTVDTPLAAPPGTPQDAQPPLGPSVQCTRLS